ETYADHDPKSERAEEPENEHRRPALRKRAAIKQGAEKDRQEPGLEKLDLPAVPVPDLADVNDGHVHCPKNSENDRIGVTGENNERQTKASPREDRQCVVRDSKPEERRHSRHASRWRTELGLDNTKKMTRWC